jgi:hypothetical protein
MDWIQQGADSRGVPLSESALLGPCETLESGNRAQTVLSVLLAHQEAQSVALADCFIILLG